MVRYTLWLFNVANWRITMLLIGKSWKLIHFYGPFSIAMLNDQRVCGNHFVLPKMSKFSCRSFRLPSLGSNVPKQWFLLRNSAWIQYETMWKPRIPDVLEAKVFYVVWGQIIGSTKDQKVETARGLLSMVQWCSMEPFHSEGAYCLCKHCIPSCAWPKKGERAAT